MKFPKHGVWLQIRQFEKRSFGMDVHSLDDLLKELKDFFTNEYTEEAGDISIEICSNEDEEN